MHGSIIHQKFQKSMGLSAAAMGKRCEKHSRCRIVRLWNTEFLHTTSQELNICPLFSLTSYGYNKDKRFYFIFFIFSSPLFLLQKPRCMPRFLHCGKETRRSPCEKSVNDRLSLNPSFSNAPFVGRGHDPAEQVGNAVLQNRRKCLKP